MAKEMLDYIRRAEAEAVNREKMARNSAENTVSKAKADAAVAVDAAVAEARARAAELEQQTKAQCAVRSAENQERIKARCERLAAVADQNRDRVTAMVIDCVVGN